MPCIFWKRAQSQDVNKNDTPAYSEIKKSKEQRSISKASKPLHEGTASPGFK